LTGLVLPRPDAGEDVRGFRFVGFGLCQEVCGLLLVRLRLFERLRRRISCSRA
jgi:hypothetical protein